MYDNQNVEFLHLENYLSPRIGVVWDPTNDGRSKVFAHFGQYYETIPMSLAARYFGGEGILIAAINPASCTNPPATWTGGPDEWRTCTPDMNPAGYASTTTAATTRCSRTSRASTTARSWPARSAR